MQIIYTCNFGGKDELCDSINAKGARLVCFTDDENLKSDKWEIVVVSNLFVDPRRNSRIAKMLPHIYFPEAEYSLYLDANIIIKVPMQKLIDEWLNDTDIAMFSHSTRDCLFEEAIECIRLELDNKDVIENHVSRYADFPIHRGLWQGGVILRDIQTK